MNAQQSSDECGTPDPTTEDPSGVYSHSTDSSFFNNCDIVVFNIKFWGINRPNETNDFPNKAHDVLQGIANLNILYNQFGIYFKYKGYEEIDSPLTVYPNGDPDLNGYYVLEDTGQYYALRDWVEASGHKDQDAFNVYAYGWGAYGGYAFLGHMSCAVMSGGLMQPFLSHEIGHLLNIWHTKSAYEHTTRDPNNINFNADTAGDRVVDTAANFGFNPGNTTNCDYTGNETDNTGDPYKIYHEDLINTMSVALGMTCWEDYFTVGQGIRLREGIANNVYNVNIAKTEISSLYEPYQGEYYLGGPAQDPNDKPLFQPGFDYRFVSCSCGCPQPSDYNDVSFSYTNTSLLTISKYETDFSIITHPNHTAIWIDLPVCDANGQNTRRCYDNYNYGPISGSVTRFNDGVLNANVTITPKDSTEINNTELVNELNPGLYKIEKNYDDGTIDQTIISKEN